MRFVALLFIAFTVTVSTARADTESVPMVIAPPPPPSTPRHKLGTLTKVGLGLFGAGYAAAIVGGASLMIWNRREQSWDDDAYGPELYTYGGLLLIPLAGPFVSAAQYSNNASWAYPWAIIDGPLQLAGFGVLIAGLIQDAREAGRREANVGALDLVQRRGFTLTPVVSPTSLGFSGTF